MKNIIKIILTVLTVFLLVACSSASNNNNNNKKQETPKADEKTQHIVDMAGVDVTLPKEVKKVASPYFIVNDILVTLGVADKMVGIEKTADKRMIYHKVAPEVLSLPRIGSIKEINVEEIASLEPDVVFLPKSLKETANKLNDLSVATILVSLETPEDLNTGIRLIGDIVGKKETAKKLLDYYNEKLLQLSSEVEISSNKPRVYVASDSDILNCTTPLMFQAHIVEKAGGELVTADLTDNYWAKISIEQLQVYAPDVIFIAQGAGYTADDLYNNVQFKGIPAVDNRQIYTFPARDFNSWDIPIPTSLLGIFWASNKLHPEIVSEEKLKEEVSTYFKTFFPNNDVDVLDNL